MELKNIKMPGFLLKIIIHIHVKILNVLLHSESNDIKPYLQVGKINSSFCAFLQVLI